MPVAPGEKIIAADIPTKNYPIVRLVQTAAQSIPVTTATPLSFTTEDKDDYGFHDPVTNNSRITPTVSGWYRFYGCYFTAAMTTPTARSCHFRKNGAGAIAPGPRDAGGALTSSKECTALIYCNGTTDYVELMASQTSAGATNTNVAAQQSSVFECEYRILTP